MAFAGDFLEMQFWCCPGLGHLNPFIKLHRGVLYEPPSPIAINLLFNNI